MNVNAKTLGAIGFLIFGAATVFSFQNCAKDPANSGSLHLKSTSLEDDQSPILPKYFSKIADDTGPMGNCTISNNSRNLNITVYGRSSKTDCSQTCLDNRKKFAGESISCSFPGVYFGGTTVETKRNHCVIKVNQDQIAVDDYTTSRSNCVSQCQSNGTILNANDGMSCEWQNQLFFEKDTGASTANKTGSCNITISDSGHTVPVTLATVVFSSGISEGECDVLMGLAQDHFGFTPTKTFSELVDVTMPVQ